MLLVNARHSDYNSRAMRNLTQSVLTILVAGALSLPALGSLIYLESGGVVVGEAELFSNRIDNGPNGWRVVPD